MSAARSNMLSKEDAMLAQNFLDNYPTDEEVVNKFITETEGKCGNTRLKKGSFLERKKSLAAIVVKFDCVDNSPDGEKEQLCCCGLFSFASDHDLMLAQKYYDKLSDFDPIDVANFITSHGVKKLYKLSDLRYSTSRERMQSLTRIIAHLSTRIRKIEIIATFTLSLIALILSIVAISLKLD